MNSLGFTIGTCAAAMMLCASFAGSAQDSVQPARSAGDLKTVFAAQGIHIDVEKGLCTIPARVLVRDDLLEYLLVNPHGQTHESMFVTEVVPSVLNVALLALGVKPGRNTSWVAREPAPSPEEIKDGVSPYTVVPPQGDAFYFYAAWRAGDETYFYRVEDLVLDRSTGQTMRRHKWVYLGSRLVKPRADKQEEAFAADLEGNLVNVALFDQGNTLVTAALEECTKQTIWMTNFWLVPPRDAQVELIFSREKLAVLPSAVEARLPVVSVEAPPQDER
ncbi:MAG: hypothetical protein JNL28_14200 [Planctomycetes bacterium]|nr:hypothetical protein [Planctomycetota bacterium]